MSLSFFRLRVKKLLWILSSFNNLFLFLKFQIVPGLEHEGMIRGRSLNSIVDIGANKGQFSLACRQWMPTARIFSFEPLKRPSESFVLLFKNDPHTHFYQKAIGPSNIKKLMNVSNHLDSSSLLAIGEMQVEYFPGTQKITTEEVDLVRLADVLNASCIYKPALLKLDVQGFEFDALNGCEDLLEQFDFIYCECSFIQLYEGQKLAYQIIDWLSARGFKFSSLANVSLDKSGNSIQADFLFCKQEID
jgi:FkbM family methyltransferase